MVLQLTDYPKNRHRIQFLPSTSDACKRRIKQSRVPVINRRLCLAGPSHVCTWSLHTPRDKATAVPPECPWNVVNVHSGPSLDCVCHEHGLYTYIWLHRFGRIWSQDRLLEKNLTHPFKTITNRMPSSSTKVKYLVFSKVLRHQGAILRRIGTLTEADVCSCFDNRWLYLHNIDGLQLSTGLANCFPSVLSVFQKFGLLPGIRLSRSWN